MKTGVEGKLDLEEMGKHVIEMAQIVAPPTCGRIKQKPVGDVGVQDRLSDGR